MPYARSFDGPFAASDLGEAFRHQLGLCGLGPGQLCLILTDTAWNQSVPAAALSAALALGAEAYVTTFPASRPLPSRSLAPAWVEADLILYMTHMTLHYRPEIAAALDRGARVLCVMQPPHVLTRLVGDPEVRRRCIEGAARLDRARRIAITSPAGTDLRMDKAGRRGLAHYGYADRPGHLDFWGAGMVQAAQNEGSTEGRLVLDVGDCVFHLARFVESRVAITFESGRAVRFEGGLDARLIESALAQAGDEGAWQAGHMAWGVDRRARWLQPILDTPDQGGGGADSEAFHGVVQVELGSNDDIPFGGRNRSAAHLGLCLRNASLWLDGEPVINEGRFVDPTLN